MTRKIKRIVIVVSIALTMAALVDQLRRPAGQRDWQGSILGVPYDFRVPTPARLKAAWWDMDDPRLFKPRAFGIGWDLNLARLADMLGKRRREEAA